jgi:hypothetical protein|tara:strand:+ start:133 stop:765 length:633 start_codon:yes stop_codon:yes gene_type:complete
MSLNERNTNYLMKRKIIYRRDPVSDIPTETFEWGVFYQEGTYQCYNLFASKAKINTYKSLKWHLYTLWYLNPQMNPDSFTDLTRVICDNINGFVTFKVSEQLIQSMVYDVSLMDLEKPPPNKLRKIIFKDFCGLDTRQKLSIVGQMVGRKKLSDSEIYEAMLMLHDNNEKITITKLATYLKCSTRTVHRNIGNELKKEKELLNQQLCQRT